MMQCLVIGAGSNGRIEPSMVGLDLLTVHLGLLVTLSFNTA